MRRFLSLAGALLLCAPAAADQFDFSFNGDAIRALYAHDMATRPLRIDGGWLYNADNGNLLHLGLNVFGNATEGANPVKAGLGGRLAYLGGDGPNQDGLALAIGGFLRYTIPSFNRFSVGAEAYWAPEITSFADAKEYTDLSIRASYNVLREADVYIGARSVKGDYDNGSVAHFDTGMHLGISLRF